MLLNSSLLQKEILTLEEAALYTGLSKSYLYKKDLHKTNPILQTEGKLIFFKRNELDQFLLSTRISSQEELLQNNMESITFKTKQNGKN